MQKKLIALAIAGLSGAAFAQSNVTVYGQVNMAYQQLSGTQQNNGAYTVGSAAAANVNGLAQADSRLGFKGEEDLGGGLKAIFTLEYGINPDQGGTNVTGNNATSGGNNTDTSGLGAAARETKLGLTGNFGTVTVGRQYTPFFDAAAAIDPFAAATGNVASTARLHPIAAIARADNSIKYVSPLMNGFLVAAMYGMSERTTSSVATGGTCAAGTLVGGACVTGYTGAGLPVTAPVTAAGTATTPETGKVVNLKLAYVNGPILAGITWIKLSDNAAGTTTAIGTANVSGTNTKALAWGGTYDFKTAKLHLLNDRVKVENSLGVIADRNDWMLGVSVPMGASTIKVSWNKVDERSNNAATTGNLTANDANMWGLGYSYAMSKRTTLFANYAKISNKGNASFGVGATQSGVGTLGGGAAAERTTGLQLGMGHSF